MVKPKLKILFLALVVSTQHASGAARPDLLQFMALHDASEFRQAQRAFAEKNLEWKNLTLKKSEPTPAEWGSLPYSPVRELPPELDLSSTSDDIVVASSDPQLQAALDRATDSELTVNEELRVFQNGASFEPLMRLVSEATRYVFIEVLSFTCDDVTEPFVRTLESQARQGRDVRLLVNKTYAILSRSCLSRLESAGVKIAKGPVHSSYFVTDRGEMMIGSQSVARMFFKADGFNFLDRDLMLYARGPVVTDAVREFLARWGELTGDERTDSTPYLAELNTQIARERLQKSRGGSELAAIAAPVNACRFLAQRPKGARRALENGALQMIKASKSSVFFSGVKVSPWLENASPSRRLLAELKLKSREGVTVDYLGNGRDGGNGELTMVLNEWISGTEKPWLRDAIAWVRDWDAERTLRQHQQAYIGVMQDSEITVWTHFNFVHYKMWGFDNSAFLISSANLHDESWNSFFEAGVLCWDSKAAGELKRQRMLDLANSLPLTKKVLN
ncbi:MAG TPA: phospholipase D-like domain-containing protein [Bdellovibrionales bacterium]|nr:phospholipase D-like domain-containing protein [Bdellovibrionales bacterium]